MTDETGVVEDLRELHRNATVQQRLDFWVTLHMISEPENFNPVYRHPRVWEHIGHCATCQCAPAFITECENCGMTMTSVGKAPNRWCSSACRTEWRATATVRMVEAAMIRG